MIYFMYLLLLFRMSHWQLAIDHGMDVLLVGRNPDKLQAVARLISKFGH